MILGNELEKLMDSKDYFNINKGTDQVGKETIIKSLIIDLKLFFRIFITGFGKILGHGLAIIVLLLLMKYLGIQPLDTVACYMLTKLKE